MGKGDWGGGGGGGIWCILTLAVFQFQSHVLAHLYDDYLEISGRTIGKNYRETGKPQGIRK